MAMMRNLAISLIEHEVIKTTVEKGKELRRFLEPLITRAKEDTLHNRLPRTLGILVVALAGVVFVAVVTACVRREQLVIRRFGRLDELREQERSAKLRQVEVVTELGEVRPVCSRHARDPST